MTIVHGPQHVGSVFYGPQSVTVTVLTHTGRERENGAASLDISGCKNLCAKVIWIKV